MAKFSEWIKNRGEEEEKKSSSPYSKNDYARYRAEKSIGLDTFESDLANMNTTLSGIVGGWQTQETMENTRSAVESMYKRTTDYQNYLSKYQPDAKTNIGDISSYYKNALDSWDSLSEAYGYYKDADSYSKAMKKLELDKKFSGKTYDEVQAEMKKYSPDSDEYKYLSGYTGYSDLKDFDKALASAGDDVRKDIETARNIHALDNKFDLYSDIMKNPDYAEKSKYKSTQNQKKFLGMEYTDYGDETYEFINNMNDARTNIIAKYKEGNGATPLEQHGYEYMTEDEIGVFNYLYGDGSEKEKEQAYKYLEDLEISLNKRSYENSTGKWKEMAGKNILSDALLSGATSIYNMAGGIGNVIATAGETLTGKEYNPYAPLRMPSNASTDIRQYVSEGIEEKTEGMEFLGMNIPNFLYQTGMSALDTYLGAQMFGSGYSVIMASNAFQQKAKEMVEAGESPEIVMASGGMSAMAEYLLEKSGLDNLLKIKNADSLKNIIVSALKQAGIEGLEEMGTEIVNILSDTILRGNRSELKTMAQDLRDRGFSQSEINTEIAKQIASQVGWAGAGGALSGLAMGGTFAGSQYHNLSETGKQIMGNETAGDLMGLAGGLTNKESEAYKLYTEYANKGLNADNISSAKLGNLYNAVEGDVRNEYKTARENDIMRSVANKANEFGDSNNSGLIASAIQKKTDGQRLSSEERTALKSDTAQAILQDGVRVKASDEFDNALANMKRTESIITPKTEAEKARLQELKKLKTGEKTINAEGNEVTIEGVKTENGATTIQTSQGEVLASEMTFSSSDAEIVSYAQNMTAEKADLFVKMYDGKMNVDDYATSFDLAYSYGENKMDLSNALRNRGVLTEAQALKAYEAGNVGRAIAKQKAVDEINAKYSGKTFIEGKFDDSIIDYEGHAEGKIAWADLTERQRKSLNLLKAIAKVTGVNVSLITSKVVDEKTGKRKGENGRYEASTNTIYIDVFAGIDAGVLADAIVPTFSHEITHWMKAKAPVMYQKMQDYLLTALAERGNLTLNQLIAKEKYRMKQAHPDQNVTDEDAIDELVARGAEDMLSNSEKVRELLGNMTESEQKTFIDKVKEVFQNIIDWVNDLLGQYNSKSDEAKLLRQYEHRMKELSKMWDEALTEAIQTNQSMQAEGITDAEINAVTEKVGVGVDTETESAYPAPQMSERTWTASEYVQDKETAVNALVKAIGVTKADAERYIDNINGIAKLIADDRARLDYDPNVDEKASVLKTNKDYKWTVDMSTLCAKRLLFTGTFDAIQKKLPNTALDSDDIVALRSLMVNRGYEVACGICYVESTRRELGTITEDFIERYKLSQKTGKPITRVNSKGKVVELTKTQEEKKTTIDKSSDKFFADKNYTPTLAELNTTDIDRVKVEHPAVYEAYLNYMNARGQAKPKLLETRTEYKGEIAKMYARTKAGKLNQSTETMNASGGLRLQSFSDFEIAHLIDMMQITLDMSRVGLMSQAYTKVPAFAEVFGDTGIKINLSLIAKDSGLDENGNLIFDDVEGINHEEAFRLRDKYSKNVGTILVGKNDAHIIKAMADPRIDYIIPFHKSSWKESLYDALGLTGYDDYTNTQNEKPIDKDRKIQNFKPSEYWDYSKSGDENAKTYLEMCKADGRIPKFPQFQTYEGYWKLLIDFKMYDNDGVGSPQTAVMPNFDMESANRILHEYEGGHRKFPVAEDVVKDFVDNYKKEHPQAQYSDRTAPIAEDDYKNMVKHFGTTGNFNVAGYMLQDGKILDFSGKHWGDTTSRSRQVDHRDIQEVLSDDNNGVDSMVRMISNGNIRLMPETGGINLAVPPTKNQRTVLRRYIEFFKGEITVDIDAIGGDTIEAFRYDKGTSADRIMRDIDNYFRGGRQSELMRFHTQYSDRDYMDAVNRGDMETAQKMVDEVAKKAGYTKRVLHGTQKFGFTVPDTSRSDDNLSFFATSDVDTAKTYSSLGGIRRIGDESDYDEIENVLYDHERYADETARELADSISAWAGYYGFADASYIQEEFKRIADSYKEGRVSREDADTEMYELATDIIAQGYDEDSYDGQEFAEWQDSEEAEKLYTKVNNTIEAFFNVADFERNAEDSGNYDLYANTDGFLVIEGNGAQWNNLKSDVLPDINSEEYKKYGYRNHWNKWTTRSVSKYASDNGYRGVLFKNIYDDGGKAVDEVRKPADVYSFFYPQEQIKSADPVTYDDQGNVIPLSERFNTENEDIRYSDRDLGFSNRHVDEFLASLDADELLDLFWGDVTDTPKKQRAKRRVDEVKKRLDAIGLTFTGTKSLAFTNERIEQYLRQFGASTPNYAQAYIAYMTPQQYLNLTMGAQTHTVDRIENESASYGEVDFGKLDESGVMYLSIKEGKNKAEVTGHEGRHRMLLLGRAGFERIPVLLFDYRTKYDKTAKDSFKLTPQVFDEDDFISKTREAVIHDVVPFSTGNKDLIIQKFGSGVEADVHYSDRDYTSVYELMGEKETLDEENRKLKADIEKLKATIGSEDVKITRFRSLADYLKKLAGSNYSREALGDSLKNLYNYIQTTDDLKWYNVMAKAEEIANDMMQLNVPINYFREVMTDIRQDKVSLSEEQYAEAVKLYGSYGNLHKALFGSINLTKSGKPLEEQWKDWSKAFPTVFKADISAVDMVKELRDTVDALKNTSAVMGEYERQEAIRHMGMEIYNQFWNIASDSSEAVRKERVAHREMMQEMRKDYEKRQAEKTLHPTGELALKYEKLLKDTIKRDRAEMKRIRELGNKRMEEYKERAEIRATIQKITKNALTLNEWFVKNSKDKHIPEDMKGAVVQLITAIDFSSKQMLGIGGAEERRGQPTQKDVSLAKALSRLYEVADEMKDNQTEDEVFLDLDIPDSAVALLKQLSTKSLVLNQMTLEQLQALDVIVSTFKSAIIKANKNFVLAQNETRERTSNLLIHDADSLVEKKADNLATNFLEYANTTPYYMLKRLGRVGEQIFNALMDAQEQLVFLEEEIINFVKKTVDGQKIKQWSEEIHEIKILDGKRSTKEEPKYKTIKMTTAQIMSLYALEKRESAKLHLAGGGIRIANIKDGLNTIKDAEGSSLSNSELYSIIGRLTNEQKRVADALQKFMSETGAEWGNKVTMARWDIKQFGEENYFPMATVAQDRNLDDVGKKDNSIYRLLNMSFTKELTPKANNQLVIDNIFDVFSSHMTDMAKYTTHALPLLDTMKILGYSRKDFYKDEDGKTTVRHDTISVASSIRRAFGDNGYRYIINLLKDLNGVEITPRDEAITKTLMSNYKISAVGGNLRVALLQGSAFVKAGLVMNPNYLIKALGTNGLEGIKKAMKHSGIALWKSKGHYDLNIARSVASEIKQDENWMDKVREWSLKGAEWGDKITWGYLWNACELWAKENTPYSYNSAEFNKAVADKLREIIVKTQVVDSTMTRSQMMRGKSAMVQTLTAFMSESTMTYNMVADAFFEWSLDARKSGNDFKAYKNTFSKHGRKFATTASVYALTAFMTAVAGGFVDAVRDDDEEKEFDEKYLENLLESLKDNVNLFANLPILKDIVSIAQGYSPSRFDEQSFVNLVSGYKKWVKVAEGEGNVYSATYKTLQGLSQLTGLPVSNMMRDVVAMWNSTIGEMYPNLKIEQ